MLHACNEEDVMAGEWKPSDYKPRGGWRAMLPGWPALLAALGFVGVMALKVVFLDHDASQAQLSFVLMKIFAAVVAMACVAPHLFSGKAPPAPGSFPTDKHDAPNRVDDRDR
jgi:hypothetical protein